MEFIDQGPMPLVDPHETWEWEDVASGMWTLGSVLLAPANLAAELTTTAVTLPGEVAHAAASVPITAIQETGKTLREVAPEAIRSGQETAQEVLTHTMTVAGEASKYAADSIGRNLAFGVAMLPISLAVGGVVLVGGGLLYWHWSSRGVSSAQFVAQGLLK